MKAKLLAVAIILIFVCSMVPPSQQVSASSYEINYTLTLEQEDYPEVTIRVQGYPEQSAVFVFLGSAVNNITSLNSIFQKMEVKDLAGKNLPWQWVNKGISVNNGSIQDFTIRYSIDAIRYQPGQNSDPNAEKSVLFRFRRIFFIAGDVFLTPKLEPEKIRVDYSLPEGTTLYASLPLENGTFQAVRDYWGNLQRDFSMAYFAGGHALFALNHTTDWGDEYQYIWFDRDSLSEAWTPLYGNTPWEQAELYMESTESCAGYYRDTIGSLPNHRVLFTNVTPQYPGFPSAGTNQDWYHNMQILPRFSEPDICHEVFHQYSFSSMKEQSKLVFAFGGDAIGNMLWEGLPSYYEQILPSLLLGDPRYSGKLFEIYVKDVRGISFGVRGRSAYHVKYNLSTLRVYMLDQYIRERTNGNDSLDGFVRAMWENVKNNIAPETISQSDVLAAFSSVVGVENAGYLNQVASMSTFDLTTLEDLRSPFSAYADWMTQEFFWGKPLLFYMYLDIAVAKGNEWPLYATSPHIIPRYRPIALQPAWDFLSAHSENPITKKEILDAMQAATVKNHSGFFEFWESLGVTLDPNEIADLAYWNPRGVTPKDALPTTWSSVGTLKTKHFLGGVPQPATIHLDNSAPTSQIYIYYQYIEEGSSINFATAEEVIQGENVRVIKTFDNRYGNLNSTGVEFVVTTKDSANQDYPITLTYPLGKGVSRFVVNSEDQGTQLGELYYLGPIQPITFELDNKNNEVILPDTPLESESFLASSTGETVQYKPGDKIQLDLASGPIEVQLFDKYGYLRGLTTAIPLNLPPLASFSFNLSETYTQMMYQFADASSDPDGQIKEWLWNFGDGHSSKEKDPQHTYNEGGSYSVTLTVIDEGSEKDSYIEKIQVEEKPQPAIQNSHAKKGLFFLIGGGIFIGGGLVIILVLSQKKKRKTQIRKDSIFFNLKPTYFESGILKRANKLPVKTKIIVLGVIVILTVIIGIFHKELFESITGFLISKLSSTGTITESPPDINSTKVSKIDGVTMLFVPAGKFLMGSLDAVGESNEHPQHEVTLKSFWIDQTEISNSMYKKCVNEGFCTEPFDDYYFSNASFDSSPVTSINWNQAKTYCEWAGRNLPTEAQWEKAARGVDGQTYPWGEEIPNSIFANFGDKGSDDNTGVIGSQSPVYSFPKGLSPYGVYNMAGNAAEWVADWYGDYQDNSQNDPIGPELGEYRVVRGGSTINNANYIRSAFRNKAKQTTQNSTIGFRCVMPAE